MRLALLRNPAVRVSARTRAIDRACQRLSAAGVSLVEITGADAADTEVSLSTAIGAGLDGVLAAGGDGTVHLALTQLSGTSIPLGILPIGTGNDMATALGIAEGDLDATIDAVLTRSTRRVDLARVTRADGTVTSFGTVLASGFDSQANDRANTLRWPTGAARYDVAVAIEFLFHLAPIPYEIDLVLADGTDVHLTENLLVAAVGNGHCYGGGVPICPQADPSDGLLDITLVRSARRIRLLRILRAAYRGRHLAMREVTSYRIRRARLSSPGITGWADGDPLGALPLTVEVDPGALTVFSPRTSTSASEANVSGR